MNCIDLTSKRSKMLSYVANHSKQRQTTKVIKKQWLASIWCQNDQRNAKLWKWSNYNELHRFDVQTIKNVELRRRTFKTAKLQKWSNWTSKRAKMMSYVAKHSKLRKTTKSIKLQWIASIWRQNDLKCWLTSQTIQNNAKLQKWSKNNDLHRFDVKTIKATQNFESDQIIMNCIDLTSKRSKMLSYVAEHSKPLNYKSDQIERQNELKCWVTSQNIQNNAKLQKLSKNNDLHRFDVKTIKATQNSKRVQIPMNLHRFEVLMIKNVELRRKPFKTAKLQKWSNWTSKRAKMMSYVANHSKPLNYKSDQIGRQNELKCWVTSQTIQNNAKLQKWSKNNDLHRFDVKTIKATQNSKRDQIPMNLHRFEVLMIKNVELRKPFKTAKLQKWSNWTSKRAKMMSYVAKHSKQRKTTKSIKL